VNMTDGQDGLAGGLAALAALGLGVITGEGGMALGLGLSGALSAFLIWNRPPARIFLGNGGAYAVGTMLGVLAVQAAREAPNPWTGLLAAGAVLGVFAFELLFTILRRVLSRRPLIPGDRLHSYDLASTVVESRTRTTLLFWAVGAAVGALGLLIRAFPLAGAIAVAAVLAAAGIGAGVGLWSRLRAETS
jgi:UDP-GlcNAc:undecaprenyl-phosphate GlcNAc-1-phosphate transferase